MSETVGHRNVNMIDCKRLVYIALEALSRLRLRYFTFCIRKSESNDADADLHNTEFRPKTHLVGINSNKLK